MIDTIYIEEEIFEHPRVKEISTKLKGARIIKIERFSEVFNPKNQSFRMQKRNPALILAKKTGRLILSAPTGFGIGGVENFYFSHMYNCLYDCNYCFLQGLYSSANYVIFINYEDFMDEILKKTVLHQGSKTTFFSGYDCDSLAFEKITRFAEYFLPRFENIQNAEIEIRTKSINIDVFKRLDPIKNCIIAFSLSPEKIANSLDKKTPTVRRRLEAIRYLAEMGWQVGLRFDPLIYSKGWQRLYSELFEECFSVADETKIHSVSFGPLRFPKEIYKKIKVERPKDEVFIGPFETVDGTVKYRKEIEDEMLNFCEQNISLLMARDKIFRCIPEL